MLRLLYPREYVDDVFSVDWKRLYDEGFRGIILDIDNTLVHHGDDSNEKVDGLFRDLQTMGFRTLVLSNNSRERVERFLANIDSRYICNADKPKKAGYLNAVRLLGIPAEQIVCVGDQLFTDILGANLNGMTGILVRYIKAPGETRPGKRRLLEGLILKLWQSGRRFQGKPCDTRRTKRDDICP